MGMDLYSINACHSNPKPACQRKKKKEKKKKGLLLHLTRYMCPLGHMGIDASAPLLGQEILTKAFNVTGLMEGCSGRLLSTDDADSVWLRDSAKAVVSQ